MRIYQLNTFCGVKSTGRIAYEIAKLVEEDGGECRIGYGVPDISQASKQFAYRIGGAVERKLHAVLRKLFDAEGYGSYFATRRLIHDMRAFDPQLIHLHNLHGCYLHLPTLFRYLKTCNVPVVWTLHDCWPFTGHCAYFDYVECDRWQTSCRACPQQRSYPVCIGTDGSARNHRLKKKLFTSVPSITFVPPCNWMNGPLGLSFLKDHPVRVIPNGVDLATFRPVDGDLRKQHGLHGKMIVLSVAAEWDERKGLRYLLEARRQLDERYVFVVIGLSQEQIDTLPSGMLGFTHTHDTLELAQWYTTADCLANPTMEDNMPMVNLEALACGTPIAAFATGGCPEAVGEDGGLIVPKGDVDALCRAIQTLCDNKPQMTDACVERAQQFDAARTFRAYLELYKELCK